MNVPDGLVTSASLASFLMQQLPFDAAPTQMISSTALSLLIFSISLFGALVIFLFDRLPRWVGGIGLALWAVATAAALSVSVWAVSNEGLY